ncbi:MAG: hypothetical protein AAGK97_01250, partial [Bacteroidota bacterium]
LTKEVSLYVPAASGADENYDVTYSFIIANTGDASVSNINLVENLVAQFGGAFVQSTPPVVNNILASAGSTAPTANPSYDGGVANDSIFLMSSGGILEPGGTITFELLIELDPDAPGAIYNMDGALENQAVVSGTDPLGSMPIDSSDSGDDPTGTNPDAPGDTGGDDDPTPLFLPEIGIAKSVATTVPAASGTLGNFDVTYTFIVQNIGMSELTNVAVIEDFVSQLGGAFVSTTLPVVSNVLVSSGSTAPAPNGAYDGGVSSDSVFTRSSGGILLVDGTLAFDITIEIDPDNPTANYGPNGTLDNQATAVGTDPNGFLVEDDSDSGTDPDGTNPTAPGDNGTNDDPTPLIIPEIGIAKSVAIAVPANSGIAGNFDVTYTFVVQNLGNSDLQNITVQDDLLAQLGGAFVSTTIPVISNISVSAGSIQPSPNGAYDGGVSNDFIFDATSGGLLVTGGTLQFDLTVEIDPDNPGAIVSANGTLDNQATAMGTDPSSGTTVMDLSDSGTDPAGDNPGEPGDMMTSDDPTPLALPGIGIAKSVGAVSAAATPGNFIVTYSFVVANLGMTDLFDIVVGEDFSTWLGGAFVSSTAPVVSNIVLSGTGNAPIANPAYDGGVMDSLVFNLNSGGALDVGSSFRFDITVEINPADPNANYSMNGSLDNQASVSAIDDNETFTSDISDSGTDPAGTNPNAPGDTGGSNDPTPLSLPEIAIVKSVSSSGLAASDVVGNFDVTYSFIVQNTGTAPLTNVSVVDDLVSGMGGAFVSTTMPVILNVVASAGSTAPTANPAYDGGVSNDSIFNFASGGVLQSGGTISFDLVIEIDPDNPTAIYNPVTGTIDNQAQAIGTDPSGAIVDDLSDSGTDPTTDNPTAPGDMGTMDDPTPINLPAIAIVKVVGTSADASSGVQGNFDVTYDFLIQNLGNTPLSNIEVEENLLAQIGGAFVTTTQPLILNLTASDGSTAPTANPNYDGAGDPNVFLMNTGDLIVGGTISFSIQIEVDPNAPGIIVDANGNLNNQATVMATDPDDTPVTDDSDSGTDPQGSNPDAPGDMMTPDDPTPLILPSIETAKSSSVSGPSVNGVIGHFDIVYSFVIMNTGNVPLSNVSMVDDLASQLGSAFVASVTPVVQNVIATGNGVAPNPNPDYDGGITNDSIFNQSGGGYLEPGDMITFDLLVTIAPNAPGAPSPLLNQARASGNDPNGTTTDDDTDAGTDPQGTNPNDPNDMMTSDDSTLTELPVTLFCPDDLLVDCPASNFDTSATGVPQAFANCRLGNSITLTFVDDDSGLNGCGNTGTLIRTWTATDDCGNVATCEQMLTVQDTTAPIITFCPPDTVASCDLDSIRPDVFGWATAVDECSNVQIRFFDDTTGFNGMCINGNVGTITRNFYAVDDCEVNISYCQQIIQLIDTVGPTIVFNDPFLVGYEPGDTIPYQCFGRTDTTWQLPMMDTSSVIATDNCSNGVRIEF